MSSIADQIKTSQDKDGMLRRALERIIQLYTDKSHFVYELLQNAEDAEAKSIKFVQHSDCLEVYHDGRPFTTENLQGLCDIGKSDKVDNLNQIGEFGVGFKSVFGICETVKLFSYPQNYRNPQNVETIPFAVEIHDFTRPEDIPNEPLTEKYTTKFVFPYTVGKTFSGFKTVESLANTVSRKLQNLGITTLLFMKNLELIEYEIHLDNTIVSGEYLLDKKNINDHCFLVSAFGASESKTEGKKKKDDETVSYLKFTKPIDMDSQRSVDIAFPVKIDKQGNYTFQKSRDPYVSVYFPTETESKLDFIVQGPFRTTPNRSSIPAEDKDNINLAELTAQLYEESILELQQMQILNMSLVKILPLSAERFDNFDLFLPLYKVTKKLFSLKPIIPTNSGEYVSAVYAKLARSERLVQLFSDVLLTSLISDGQKYKWLPTYLTENSKEYQELYHFFSVDMHVQVIRPEDLRSFFAKNPAFLPARPEEWLVELYSVLENVGTAFSRSSNELNMLVANIIKTSKGEFVAPYRRTENKQYIPNVFIPTDKFYSDDINFVDEHLYLRCRHFFDDILQLQKPNEYEFITKDIKKRYSGETIEYDEKTHIEDIKHILKYLQYDEFREEIQSIIDNDFYLLCKDGLFRNSSACRLYVPFSPDGVNIEGYYKNITESVYYVDSDFYQLHGITFENLVTLGVHTSILLGESETSGTYDVGSWSQPEWWTYGDFRWKLSIDSVKKALEYIVNHQSAKDAILKSQAILKTVFNNESKLQGTVFVSRSMPNLENEYCELIKILRGERMRGWSGKWLFTDSGELVSPKDISRYDLSVAYYGPLHNDSIVYDLLGFKKTEADEANEIRKSISKAQLDALFESELRQRFGISSFDLRETFGGNQTYDGNSENSDDQYPFPVVKVKNWEALKKHAAEMLCYADPVTYQYKVRSIRVSNREKEARAYLLNMYRYDGVYKYACQLCHDSTGDVEIAQIFNKPEVELDPMNLCLCPNCAAKYRRVRDNGGTMEQFKLRILGITESDVRSGEQVIIPLDDYEVWFTQIHFAEIQELLKLKEEVTDTNSKDANKPILTDKSETDGLAVFNGYIGKTLKRPKDGFVGVITDIDEKERLIIKVTEGDGEGEIKKIPLSFLLNNMNKFVIS